MQSLSQQTGKTPLYLFAAGYSHRRTPLHLRERYFLAPDHVARLLVESRQCSPLAEAVIMNTCNRFEVYAVSTRHTWNSVQCLGHMFRMIWPDMPAADFDELLRESYFHADEECMRHLFRTAAGLNSMVVGEAEITGQVKDAYHAAHAADATGPVLNRLFQNAFSAAKRVRTESEIGRGFISIGTVAVQTAAERLGGEGNVRSAVVCGAGQMGRTVALHLRDKTRFRIAVANRSPGRAEAVAAEAGGAAASLQELPALLPEADVVVSALSATDFVLTRDMVADAAARRVPDRPLVLVDISLPRTIDPAVRDVPGVELIDLDELGALVRANQERRVAQAEECERLVQACVAEYGPRLLYAMHRGPLPAPAVPIRPSSSLVLH